LYLDPSSPKVTYLPCRSYAYDLKSIARLFELWCEPNPKEMNTKNLLLVATELGHTFIVAALVNRSDVNLNIKTNFGQTALSLAVENGHFEIALLLLMQKSTDVNAQDLDGQTPLGWAAYHGHLDIVKAIVSRTDTRIDIRDIDGRTPLSWAVEKRHVAIVRILLDRLGIDCGDGILHALLT
jgi:ankyrin repeat protein